MQGMIFDLDGTILDSMKVWDVLSLHYLESLGKQPKDDLLTTLAPLTLQEAAEYLKIQYQLPLGIPEILQGFYQQLQREYATLMYKEGVPEFLRAAKEKNMRLCLLTANHQDLAISTLRRLQLLPFFDQVLSCDTLCVDKQDPHCFQLAAETIACVPEQCIVIEDALHAIHSAKQAGFEVWAMYDSANAETWESIQQIADYAFTSFQLMEELLCTR